MMPTGIPVSGSKRVFRRGADRGPRALAAACLAAVIGGISYAMAVSRPVILDPIPPSTSPSFSPERR